MAAPDLSGVRAGGKGEVHILRFLRIAPRDFSETVLLSETFSIDESGTEPIVRYTKPLGNPEKDEMMRNFSPLEFLAELSCHIPRVFEQTTRFFGTYSPRARGAKRREERFQKLIKNKFQPLDSPLPQRPASQSWARCMKLVFEVDPLLCPKCGSSMKIRSFVHNPKEIDRICKSLGAVSSRSPPEFCHRSKVHEEIWLDDSQAFSQIH